MQIALLIVDMQPVHLRGRVGEEAVERACEHINFAADRLRGGGHPVVHVLDVEGMEEANRGDFDPIPGIVVKDGDLKVPKESGNAFWRTELEARLTERGAELVVIAGFAAEQCVLFTYNGAAERGFTPVLLQNGLLSAYPDAIASAVRDRNLISHPVIAHMTRRS
ncbi:Nicotinamidase-related amidase [Paenibacillus sp. UNC496MF]|uniref:cysteine hydrolase family protein n=1 Tax=Paenibacillus sp. UNC496MF TaxID=1502753 RepID=UPI0008F19237|nr:isochorismatase family cysteine hydrolase [Paenibacillus sp. UNC496MF]SFJ42410.1 Nicotinamidase-related amidase [Paenibacillus sp. UNC496MF]